MTRYGSIYVVTNTVTGEQYVGQTRQKAVRRWKCHINTAHSEAAPKYRLAHAILEYGKAAFEFAEVFSAFDAKTLDTVEMNLIAEFAPTYNIAKGGAGHRGVVASKEVCLARSERLKRQWADPDWRTAQLRKIHQVAKSPEAVARGKRVAALGIAARWANHVKKPKPTPRVKVCKPRRDPAVGRIRSAQAKWKPVYCPELACSFLCYAYAAETLGVGRSTITEAIKRKGRVLHKYTLETVA
jgi:group I intron endonuclease